MKHLLLALILLLPAFTIPAQSIGRLEGTSVDGNGQCTAFSIHAERAYWVTATHCLMKEMFIDGVRRVMRIIEQEDGVMGLAVIATDPRPEGGRVRALRMGKEPDAGDEMLQAGFGMNAPSLLLLRGPAIGPMPLPTEEGEPAFFMGMSNIEGMSGGPVLDEDGKVVSVIIGRVQSAGQPLAFGAPYSKVKRLLTLYGR